MTANDLYTSSSTFEGLPNTYEFLNALNFAKKQYQTKTISNNYFTLEDTISTLKILVKENHILDDKILVITALHHLLQNTQTTKTEIANMFGIKVADCVELLTKKPFEQYEQYAKRIITNETYPYLRQILIADMIYTIRNLSKNPSFMAPVNMNLEARKILLQYSHVISRTLLKILKQEIHA